MVFWETPNPHTSEAQSRAGICKPKDILIPRVIMTPSEIFLALTKRFDKKIEVNTKSWNMFREGFITQLHVKSLVVFLLKNADSQDPGI